MRVILLAPALLLAACASAPTFPVDADHPAATQTDRAPHVVEVTTLPPVEQPTLPPPLRPTGEHADIEHPGATGRNHGEMPSMHAEESAGMNHSSMQALGSSSLAESPSQDGLPAALDAYLAIQVSLSADQFNGVPAHARALHTAMTALTIEAPADDLHRWHRLTADLGTIQTYTEALAASTDLATARVAFGHLSPAFIRLINAVGLPDGYDLEQATCGMTPDVPEGGVWLQRRGSTANPYLGEGMLTCGSTEAIAPGRSMHDHAGSHGTQ